MHWREWLRAWQVKKTELLNVARLFCVLAVTGFVAVDVVTCVNLERAISVSFVLVPPSLLSA